MRRTLARTIVPPLLVLAFSASAAAGPLDDAIAAYQRGDFDMAERLLLPLVEQGDARPQFNLGVLYDEGRGVQLDHAEAVKWYRLAANQGLVGGENNLGAAYLLGKGVPKYPSEAEVDPPGETVWRLG